MIRADWRQRFDRLNEDVAFCETWSIGKPAKTKDAGSP